ncbi:hypothetical protein PanWU01x14_351780, partial [Parasponia andersonii]
MSLKDQETTGYETWKSNDSEIHVDQCTSWDNFKKSIVERRHSAAKLVTREQVDLREDNVGRDGTWGIVFSIGIGSCELEGELVRWDPKVAINDCQIIGHNWKHSKEQSEVSYEVG